ncbi:MAG: leucyl/phenylalanyl-tRNA--protein transferase [Abditibacteriaceae bacterium]
MLNFPVVELADDVGVLCIGGELTSEALCAAYHQGIFPWPINEEFPIVWFAPPMRGVLVFDEFHIPKSVAKMLRREKYECRIDTAFEQVISHCANRPDGTWITPDIIAAYTKLHHEGIAHSVETYQDDELVGGLYGVSWGKYFCGESMFHLRSGASKAALIHLMNSLKERGFEWIDIQNINPLFELFGAREIPRAKFMELLKESIDDLG